MRKIALISTSRADFGIQSRLIRLLNDDPDIDFSLIVSGSHLCQNQGMTIHEIEQAGLPIAYKIDIGMNDQPLFYTEHVMGKAILRFSEVLTHIKPDLVVLLGDRYEMLAAAISCCLHNIPIAHLHGGEATTGATDEAFRHAITKMALYHFTSCDSYRTRVIQLGEDPNRVFNVGSLGVENALKMPCLSKKELEESLGFRFLDKSFLITFHPVTLEQGSAPLQIQALLSALRPLTDTTLIFTHPNADTEGEIITTAIQDFVKTCSNARLVPSLGVRRYLSALQYVDAVIGNSSSGIIEVPSFKKPTINIGNRQAGRIQASSVINCLPVESEITFAIQKALSPEFQKQLKTTQNPYAQPNSAQSVLNLLKTLPLHSSLLQKTFYDFKKV